MTVQPGQGKGAGLPARGQGGTDKCICPKCRYVVPHQRGIPCNKMKCPRCRTNMQGL